MMPVFNIRCLRPAFLLAFCCLAACSGDRPQQLGGSIFGTTWSATYQGAPHDLSSDVVRAKIERTFALVNRSMNHYDPESLISTFNRLPPNEPIEVDWDFTYVLTAALTLGEATGGAYDVSVSALSDLWGFGPDGPTRLPTQGDIDATLSQVGASQLEWQPETRTLAKRVSNLKLDFSSLAKGYAVDLAADALDELGLEHYMLEVGGEVRVRGQSPRGGDWRIAVERPDPTARGSVQTALSVSDTGIATSGDYRNFFESEGRRYSHLIDPQSGYPIQHDVVSVTVVHGSAMMADAWATALIVLGSEEAMALAEQRRLAVYLLKRSGDRIEALWSAGMAQWLDEDLL
jgi:thiamine biosynthesis lipoprotein